jgi:hypothetical protein
MKKFFLNLLLVVVPSIGLIILVFLLPPSKSLQNSLLFAQADKNRMMENVPGPRIIFIGGSNLSFGLDSKKIKDSLGVNTINTGVHIALGLKYMLSNAENYIRKGDIFVIAPEYQQFYGDIADGEIELLSTIVYIVPKSIKLLDYKQYYSQIQYIPTFVMSRLKALISESRVDTTSGIYDRKAFNSFGDAYIHWKLPKQVVKPLKKISGKFNEDALNSLIDFKNAVERRKAKLFITFPCYQDLSFYKSKIQIKEVESKLIESGFNLLSKPERYCMSDSLVFDTPYHLTKEGVDLRTSLLIKDLKKCLKY